jgi:4-hydroxy-2-oxoheptanedioate aldolase
MDVPSALLRAEQGMQFLAVGSDLRFLALKSEEVVQGLWPERGKQDLARY